MAEAVLDTIPEPLLVLDSSLCVLTASRAFCSTFSITLETARGKSLAEIGGGKLIPAELHQRLAEILPHQSIVEGFEIEYDFPKLGRRILLLSAREILQPGNGGSEMLVMIVDATERLRSERERNELLRQKQVLLDEMSHRVNNSLQIIASILLLKARTVQSEETRRHLHDAHQRVVSIAEVQRHLQEARAEEGVDIRNYLSKLTASLAAAMVSDDMPIRLEVTADETYVDPTRAVSLGLITTELVINALKHAFLNRTAGRVDVRYSFLGEGWVLSISDDGIGKPPDSDISPARGLGTTLVEVLAREVGAQVETTTGSAGTTVSISSLDCSAHEWA